MTGARRRATRLPWLVGAAVGAACSSPAPREAPPPERTVPATPAGSAAEPAASLEPLPDGAVLQWSFDHAARGREYIVFRTDGTGSVALADRHGSRHLSEPTLGADGLAALAEVFRTSGVCALRSARAGLPDEPQPTMRIRLPGVACDVTLWLGEWTDLPAARDSSAWVNHARAHVHGR